MGSEDWQRDSSSVAARSKEGCCLTPWWFVGNAVGEVRADKYHAGGRVLGLLLGLTAYASAGFDIFSAVWVIFSGLYFPPSFKKICCHCVLAGILLHSAESLF